MANTYNKKEIGYAMQTMPKFEQAKILVIGDVMLDSYWMGPVSRISPEAPVPVLNIGETKRRLGGAANVALNLDSLGAEVHLLGLIGDDEQGRYFEGCLSASSIHSHIITLKDQSTITKLRLISQNQQLLRVDVDNNYDHCCKQSLVDKYEALLETIDLVILSDYAKGTLSDVPLFIQKAKQKGKSILVDPKGHDFQKYQGATLLTPNMSEFVTVAGQCDSEDIFYSKAQRYVSALSLDALLVTRGAKGMALFKEGSAPYNLKANAKEVFDVTGAGDTVIAVLGASLAAGVSMPDAMILANHAAGIVVGHLGASRVTVADLKAAMGTHERLSYIQFTAMLERHHNQDDRVKLVYCKDANLNAHLLQSLQQHKTQGYYVYMMIDSALDASASEALSEVFHGLPFIDDFLQVTAEQAKLLSKQAAPFLSTSE